MIQQAMSAMRFVLGVCLGSQLIAECLGSRVFKNHSKEIGWYPVEFYPEPGSLFEGFPARHLVCHWHGETYEVPRGAALRAGSEGCAVQAFETANAIGLQFHLEFGEEELALMVRSCGSEIGSGPYEQSSDLLLQGERQHGSAARQLLYRILDAAANRWK
jgi:GMP synthase (glutamine-hydrolysing)